MIFSSLQERSLGRPLAWSVNVRNMKDVVANCGLFSWLRVSTQLLQFVHLPRASYLQCAFDQTASDVGRVRLHFSMHQSKMRLCPRTFAVWHEDNEINELRNELIPD